MSPVHAVSTPSGVRMAGPFLSQVGFILRGLTVFALHELLAGRHSNQSTSFMSDVLVAGKTNLDGGRWPAVPRPAPMREVERSGWDPPGPHVVQMQHT